ncbi:MAG: proton-conducting transporter membrane subunit [Dehalococcoidales bacterium]|nr:proton-conducting transporter membrane subunit [Dehalococcoidales bacterium]
MLNTLFLCGLFVLLGTSLATAALAVKAQKPARQVALWALLVGSLAFFIFSLCVFIPDHSYQFTLYRITDSLHFSFTIDRLAAFFMGIISLVSTCVTFYSMRYIEHHGTNTGKNILVSMMALFVLSMLLLVASANTFSFLFFWETMSFSSFFLVMFDREKSETQKSALFYFVMTQISTVFLMFAFVAMYGINGTFDIMPLAGTSPVMKSLIFLALFTGFGIKAGVVPFHKWLPYAHSASPSNISALMSGVMIKVAIYGMVRYFVVALDPELWWGIMILCFGLISALLGVIYALKEQDIKKLLAYSTIENVGIILTGLGLYLIFRSYDLMALANLALIGGLFHTLNHALFKSLLFLTTGAVVNATGTRNIEEMGGLIKTMPYTGMLFLVGAVSIAALPPFSGFVSELMIFQAFLQSFIITSAFMKILLLIGLTLFALTSALAAACFVKAFGVIFLATPRSQKAVNAHEVSGYMIAAPTALGIFSVLFGVFSYQIFSWLGYAFPIPNLMIIGLLLIVVTLLVWLFIILTASRKTRVSETWGCGINAQDSSMEYSAAGYSEPLLTIFRPIYRTEKQINRTYHDTGKSVFKAGTAALFTLKLFEEKIYLPVARFVQRLSQAVSDRHDVDLDVYILYAFIAIVILIFAMGWFI